MQLKKLKMKAGSYLWFRIQTESKDFRFVGFLRIVHLLKILQNPINTVTSLNRKFAKNRSVGLPAQPILFSKPDKLTAKCRVQFVPKSIKFIP